MQLRHLGSLIRWLRVARACRLIQNRHDPFALLPARAKEELPEKTADEASNVIMRAARWVSLSDKERYFTHYDG